jgi:hypothetical protein
MSDKPHIDAKVTMEWKVELPEDYDDEHIVPVEQFKEELKDELGVSYRDELFDVDVSVEREIVE